MTVNRVLLTHIDFDGSACAIIARAAWPGVHVEYHDYVTIDQAIYEHMTASEDSKVVMADISPGRQMMADLAAGKIEGAAERLIILDHHKNNLFAELWLEDVVPIPGMFADDLCGADILFSWVWHDLDETKRSLIDVFCRVVRAWDLWLLSDPVRKVSEDMNRLFSFLGRERFEHRCSNLLASGNRLDELLAYEVLILSVLEERSKNYIDGRMKTVRIDSDEQGRRFAWVVATRDISEIGTTLAKLDGVSYGAIYNPELQVVNLRSIDGKEPVGPIAKARHGGGHRNAAGHPTGIVPGYLVQGRSWPANSFQQLLAYIARLHQTVLEFADEAEESGSVKLAEEIRKVSDPRFIPPPTTTY